MRGNIERRGDSTWRIRVYVGRHPTTGAKRYARRTIHGTRADADQACARLILEVGAGHHAADDHTVAELMQRWLALVEADLSPSTVRDYRYVLDRHVIPTFGDQLVNKVRPDHLEVWYHQLPIGPARVRRIHNVLSSAFDQAVRWQWIAANPCGPARPPRIRQPQIQPPEPADVRRLHDLAAETDPDLAMFIHLAARTGARRGELVALRWSDVDLDQGAMTIQRSVAVVDGGVVTKTTKTDRARRIGLGDDTVAELRRHRTRQRERALAAGIGVAEDGPVFASDPEGRSHWYPASVSRRFHRLAVRAGLDGVRLHDLRHFVATQMVAAGVDMKTVAGRLGHSHLGTLNRYAHFVPAADRAADAQLARILAGD